MAAPAENIVLLGGSGLIGSAILAKGEGQSKIFAPDSRPLMQQLLDGDSKGVIDLCLQFKHPLIWIFAAGIIDPNAPETELMRINAEVPARLYTALGRAAAEGHRVRFVTFGSALEAREEIAAVNAYIRSKVRLRDEWKREAPTGGVLWSHYQLHTLYGGKRPPPFMFLGQMEAALRQKIPFLMSSGNQLREYHHADDVAANILLHLRSAAPTSSEIALNSGCATRLRNLAEAVFDHFGMSDLLKVGALAQQQGEVMEVNTTRSEHVVAFRDPVRGIITWLENLGVVGANQ